MDEDQLPQAHGPDASTGDALDRPFVPRFGLSATTLLAIFIGGAVGTVARYLLDAHHPVPQGNFPWVTLVINLSGSLAIGLLVPLTEHIAPRAPWARPLLVVGFLGGWAPSSTLAVGAALLTKDGDIIPFAAYIAATVIGGLTLVVAGNAV